MSIIKKTPQPKSFIGVKVETYINEYLTLYSETRGVSKSKLYGKMVESWVTAKRTEYPDDVLLHDLSEMIARQRENEKQKNVETPENVMPLREFKNKLQNELLRKGLKPTYVTLIVSNVLS